MEEDEGGKIRDERKGERIVEEDKGEESMVDKRVGEEGPKRCVMKRYLEKCSVERANKEEYL